MAGQLTKLIKMSASKLKCLNRSLPCDESVRPANEISPVQTHVANKSRANKCEFLWHVWEVIHRFKADMWPSDKCSGISVSNNVTRNRSNLMKINMYRTQFSFSWPELWSNDESQIYWQIAGSRHVAVTNVAKFIFSWLLVYNSTFRTWNTVLPVFVLCNWLEYHINVS